MNQPTKTCPYCGESILQVATKCKHCGSAIDPHGTVSATAVVRRQFMMRPIFAVPALLILILLIAGAFLNLQNTSTLSGHGFTAADVVTTEHSIRDTFAKQKGVTVEAVEMMRASPLELTGYAKLHLHSVFGTRSVTKICNATMGEDSRFLWQCK